ncbi:hypothetical protein DL93DRAFT_499283 [Clavulina sp. PMI_390]|nr:hypothetical protein DL93DRAFT_499283 [Clavulina sp. PMI_390]
MTAASLTFCIEDPYNLLVTPNSQITQVQLTTNPLDSPNMPHLEPVSPLLPRPTTPTLPIILHALAHLEAGLRHGAAMCLRGPMRSMSVKHTSMGDSAALGLLLPMFLVHEASGAIVGASLETTAGVKWWGINAS